MIASMANVEDFLMTTGQRVRFARVEMRGFQGKELAAKADISPAMLSKIEHDQKKPSMEVLIALARALDVSLDWLVPQQGTTTPYRRPEDEPIYFSPEADQVARLVDDLPPKYRAIIVEQAKSVRSKFEAENQEYNALIKLIEDVAGVEVRQRIERRLLPPENVPPHDGTTLHVIVDKAACPKAQIGQNAGSLFRRELTK